MNKVRKDNSFTQTFVIVSVWVLACGFYFNQQLVAQDLNGHFLGNSQMMVSASGKSSSDGIPYHISGVLGATSIYDHGTYFTAGLDLLAKPFNNDHIDIGLASEIIWADHTEYIAGMFLGYTLSHNLPVTFSYIPSVLFVEGKSDFMHIAGVSYAYHLGELTLSPLLKFEFIQGHVNVMGGVGIGRHF